MNTAVIAVIVKYLSNPIFKAKILSKASYIFEWIMTPSEMGKCLMGQILLINLSLTTYSEIRKYANTNTQALFIQKTVLYFCFETIFLY